jgi:alpha-glucosidase (family GH31 glycosyl hydrolase)
LWTDLGEPEGVPPDTRFYLGDEKKIHNLYNYYWSKMIFEGWKRDFPDQRPVILSRSGFSGSQRFGVSVWSGDSEASFKGLKIQPVLMTQSSLSGFSWWSSDVGGFVGKSNGELYLRWSEFGLFSPVYRPHGAQVDREPWAFGPEVEEKVRALLQKRAQFLPYLYSMAYRTHKTGMPLISPVQLNPDEFDDNPLNPIENHQYWFGSSIVFRPFYDSAEESLILPDNGQWVNLRNGDLVEGLKKHPVRSIPGKPDYYLKPCGIFIYNRDPDYAQVKKLIVEINGTADGEIDFSYYDDDGQSNDYLAGKYRLLHIRGGRKKGQIQLALIPEQEALKAVVKPEIEIRIHLSKGEQSVSGTGVQDKNVLVIQDQYPDTIKNYQWLLKF